MKISEVSKIFDIPVETLRYIEQQELVHPVRNPENGYREYDLDAFSELCDYMRFRNMGIPVKGVIEISRGPALRTLAREVHKSLEALEAELRQSGRLCTYLARWSRIIETIEYNRDVFTIEKRPALVCVPSGTGEQERYTYHHSNLVTQWRKNAPFVSLAFFIDPASLFSDTWHTSWVFQADENIARELALPMDPQVRYESEQLCAAGFTFYTHWNELRSAGKTAAAFAEQRGLYPAGEMLVCPLVREGGGTWAQLSLPVDETP